MQVKEELYCSWHIEQDQVINKYSSDKLAMKFVAMVFFFSVARSPSARFSFIGAGVRPPPKTAGDAIDTPGEGRVKFEVTEKLGDTRDIVPSVR